MYSYQISISSSNLCDTEHHTNDSTVIAHHQDSRNSVNLLLRIILVCDGKKVTFYHSLIDRYISAIPGFESLGSWGPSTKYFVSIVGKKIADITKENGVQVI